MGILKADNKKETMLKETGLLVSQSGQTGLFSGLGYFSAEDYLGQARKPAFKTS